MLKKEKLKVVHIVEALGGGVYTYFKDLTHFFGKPEICEEIETIIIYSSKRKEIIPENIKKEFSANVQLIEIDMVKELSPIHDFQSVIKIRKLLKKLKPDVVHLHSSKAGVLGRFAKLGLLKNKKLFYTPHGYAFLRKDISKSKQKIYRFIENYSQKLLGGTTIACGDTEFEIAQEIGKSELVRNGINVPEIAKHYLPVQNKRLTIGIVGRITFARNPNLFNAIAETYPQYDFVWIGDGEFRNDITSSNISVTGWLYSPSEIFAHLNNLDVYLQTSLWEGLPIAVLEAMALKKPVVATNVIGNKDIVLNGATGFLFEKIEELDSIFMKLENKTDRFEMGEKAFKRCLNRFDINNNFSQLTEIYKR